MSLEESLQQHEDAVDGLLKSIKKYHSAVNGWKTACKSGHIGNIQKASALADELSQTLPRDTRDVKDTWDFDVRAYLESDAWIDELQVAASGNALRTIQDNDTLISSPVTVRSQPSRGTLLLGKVNWATIRPHIVADELKRLRDKTLAANSQKFLESLYGAGVYLTGKKEMFVKFRDIYDLFCLAPDYKKDNSEAAFAQKIYALHRSGLDMTRAGRRFAFELPSGSFKERDIFTVIAEDGHLIRYYGISFN